MGGRPDVRTNDRGVNGHGGQAHKYPFSCPPRALAGSLLADPQRERPCTKSSGFKVSTNASRLPRSSLLPMALNQYHQTSNGCLDTLTFSAWYPARPGQCHMYLLSWHPSDLPESSVMDQPQAPSQRVSGLEASTPSRPGPGPKRPVGQGWLSLSTSGSLQTLQSHQAGREYGSVIAGMNGRG